MAELISALADVKVAAASSVDENLALQRRITELEEQAALLGEMEFDGQFYLRTKGDSREGPFCQKCLDVERIACRLQRKVGTTDVDGTAWVFWRCLNCQSDYNEEDR